MSDIILSEVSFKKFCKKLTNNLSDEYVSDNNSFKLSVMQELVSKSLGFRNYNDLHSYLEKSAVLDVAGILNKEKRAYIFNDFPMEEMKSFLSFCLLKSSPIDESMWSGRAIILSSIVVEMIYFKNMQNKLLDEFQSFSFLENILKFFNESKNHDINNKIYAYLRTVPSILYSEEAIKFNDVQPSSAMEQHGYLTMQFIFMIDRLQEIQHDVIILPLKVFERENGLLDIEGSIFSHGRYGKFLDKIITEKNHKKDVYLSDVVGLFLKAISSAEKKEIVEFVFEVANNLSGIKNYISSLKED